MQFLYENPFYIVENVQLNIYSVFYIQEYYRCGICYVTPCSKKYVKVKMPNISEIRKFNKFRVFIKVTTIQPCPIAQELATVNKMPIVMIISIMLCVSWKTTAYNAPQHLVLELFEVATKNSFSLYGIVEVPKLNSYEFYLKVFFVTPLVIDREQRLYGCYISEIKYFY